jgi:hypothetical protein
METLSFAVCMTFFLSVHLVENVLQNLVDNEIQNSEVRTQNNLYYPKQFVLPNTK